MSSEASLPMRRSAGREAAVVAPLVVAAFLAAFGALHYGFYTRGVLLDTPLYERYGDAIVHHGRVPYRDFAVEYPPGSLPAFALPSLAAPEGHFTRYARLFETLMLLCGAAAAAIVGYVLTAQGARTGRLVSGTLLAGLAPLALGPVVLSRFDLWPAALTVAAVAALLADRRRPAFALLGAAVAAKLYALVLVPLALAYVWRRHGRRATVGCAAVGAAVVAVCFAPFVAVAPHGVWESLAGQASRPLQIESLGASLLLAAHQAWGLPLTEVSSHGSDNLVGRLPQLLALAQSLLGVAALGWIWIAFARGPAGRDRLIRYCAAAICAFVVLSKVLSPQYLLWLIALVPLVRGRRGIAAAVLFVSSMVLTQLWFPSRYIALVYGLDARASWLVLARDLALVALLLTLVWPAARARRVGVSLVAVLAVGAAAAVGVAATSSSPAGARVRSGLLEETGAASACGRPKRTPRTNSGTAAYDTASFANPDRRARCVTVVLRTRPGVQAFSAAYRSFDPADPQAHYLADAGICTNLAGASGARSSYAFTVAAHAGFAIEVESCRPAETRLRYALDVAAGVSVAYVAATAARRGGDVLVRWRTASEPPGLVFQVFRERDGRRTLVDPRPVRGHANGGSYALTDRGAPLDRSLRYWLRAARGGGWSWHGPVG